MTESRSVGPIAPVPRLAMCVVDPGGTTGLAIYDPWHHDADGNMVGKLWYDQIDAGLGRHVREREHLQQLSVNLIKVRKAAVRQGVVSRRTAKTGGRGAGIGLRANPLVMAEVEYGTAQHIVDVCVALGPVGRLVLEDFILGWGDKGMIGGSGREGLSPVRVNQSILTLAQARGLMSGHAWTQWVGHGLAVIDGRGLVLRGDGSLHREWALIPLPERVHHVRAWRLAHGATAHGQKAGWLGDGWGVKLRMPGTKDILTRERQSRCI